MFRFWTTPLNLCSVNGTKRSINSAVHHFSVLDGADRLDGVLQIRDMSCATDRVGVSQRSTTFVRR